MFSVWRALISSVAVAGAMRVVVDDENALSAEELFDVQVGSMLEKVERVGVGNSANQSAPDIGTLTLLMLTRQCVQEQAENFPSLMQKHGFAVSDMEENQLLNDVIAFWTLRDLRRNHLTSYNIITRQIAQLRNEEVLAMTAEIQNVTSRLEAGGFEYSGAEARCEEDGTSQARSCIMERATEFAAASSSSGLPALVSIRQELPTLVATLLELRDLQAHEVPGFDASELDKLMEIIEAIGFDLRSTQRQCKAVAEQSAAEVIEHLQRQMQNPAPSIDNCNEDPEAAFCPEGTGLMVSRPTETVRGTAAFSSTYFAAWPVLNFVAPAITTLLGFGPAIGLFFANGPFPHGAIFGSLAYAIFSTGRRQCMCFPQECHFDDSTRTCGVSPGSGMATSNNPFTSALPFMSTKCVPSPHQEGTCEMQSCGESDFSPALGDFEGAPFFGTVGQHDGGLYNCLSTSGSSADNMLIKTSFPGNGLENVAENRNKFFEAIQVSSA